MDSTGHNPDVHLPEHRGCTLPIGALRAILEGPEISESDLKD